MSDSLSPHPDIDKAPCFFCDGESLCSDHAPVPAPEVEMCEDHLSYPKDACDYCNRWKVKSSLPEWKQEELHERHNAEEGCDEYADPALTSPVARYTGRKRP